ncbi:MAG: Ig-like domain-containing protein [Ignavibacteria bacterium]|nr:Ig-like domain-containing protein [Ignavibacteria bacterium]MBI3765729.1 Ig-like domain-containing protein [Ignavibacteriales bacterium]
MEPKVGYSFGAHLSHWRNRFLFVIILFVLTLYGCTKEGPMGPQGPAGGEDLTDPSIMPKVISTYPKDRSTGPFNLFDRADYYKPNFVVQFNKLMNNLYLEEGAVRVRGFDRPVIVYLYRFYYRFPWEREIRLLDDPYSNILAFMIYDSLGLIGKVQYKIGQTYSVTLNTLLEDINGNHLTQPYQFSYTPEPYFRVVASYPENGAKDVTVDVRPRLIFNSRIDTSIYSNIQITPQPLGRWVIFEDSATVEFQPFNPLPFSALYTLSVSANARDAEGHQINSGYLSTFTSTAFQVTYTYPRNGQTHVYVNTGIYLSFSGSIDTSRISQAFVIDPVVSGNFAASSREFSFSPLDELNPATRYTVTISTAMRASDGTSLSGPFNFSFTTEDFRIDYTSPPDGAVNVNPYNTVFVYFNSKIDTGTVRGALTLNPPASFTLGMFDRHFAFYRAGGFAGTTKYTVTISTDMRSKGGVHLSSPYTFAFTTSQ